MKKRSSTSAGKTKKALSIHAHGYPLKALQVSAVSHVLASRAQELVSIGKKMSKQTGSAEVVIADESDVFHILKVGLKHGKLSSVDVVLRSFPARHHGEITGFKSVQLKERMMGRKKSSVQSRKKPIL